MDKQGYSRTKKRNLMMRPIKYPIRLTVEEQETIKALVSKGKSSARAIRRANVLVLADENRAGGRLKEGEIAEQMQIHLNTVYAIRKRYVEQGVNPTISRKKRATPPVAPKVTGEMEAKIIALSCSTPPAGRERWILSLLADRVVELQYIESISHETVRQVLKKRT